MQKVTEFFKKNWPIFVFLFFLVFITYFNSLNNDFVSDDIGAIRDNPNIGQASSFLTRPYSSLQDFLYFFIYKICGLAPICYRTSNVLFHFGSVVLIYIILSRLRNSNLAFYVASIFAVHPILIESVAWISGGPYVKYGFFLLGGFLTYVLSEKNIKYYYLSLFFVFLGLLSSEKAIVYPLILFLYEFSLGSLRKNWKKLLIPFSLTLIWVVIYAAQIPQRQTSIIATNPYASKNVNPLIQIPFALSFYLQLIIWPDKLSLYQSETTMSLAGYIFRLCIFFAFVGGVIYSYFKNKQIFFFLGFFIISLSPTLLPVIISWIVAERYVYLGSLGIFFVIGLGLEKLIQNKKTETIGYLIFIIIILGLTTRSIIRNNDWKNEDNLWIATGKTAPSDAKTHNNLGDVYGRAGDLEKAASEFITAIKLNPYYGAAYHNLANIYNQMGKKELAIETYLLAVKYDKTLWQPYQNIAVIYFEEGAIASAEGYLKKALEISPDNESVIYNFVILYLQSGDKIKAKKYLEKFIQLNPDNQQAREMLISL